MFGGYKNCLTLITFKTSADTIKCEHFFELQQVLKMSCTRLHALSRPLSKTLDSFVLWKIFPCFSSSTFTPETVFLASDEAFKKPLCITAQTQYMQGVQIWELGGHCLF